MNFVIVDLKQLFYMEDLKMDRIYLIFGCGHEYITESKLRERFERNKTNCPNGWASEYASFEDFLERGKKGHWLF